jgi:hypothetical protein
MQASDLAEALIQHLRRLIDVSYRMHQAEEARFKLGRCEVDTPLKAKMEKFPEGN